MDSHEEKLQKIITETKINEAKAEAKRKMKAIEQKKAQEKKMANEERKLQTQFSRPLAQGTSYSSGGGSHSREEESYRPPPKKSSTSKPMGGMTLNEGRKKKDFLEDLMREDNTVTGSTAMKKAGPKAAPTSLIDDAPKDKTFVSITEDLTLLLDKDGGVKKLVVNGEMKVAIFDPDFSKIVINTSGPLAKEDGYRCRLHPKINTNAYNKNGVLGLKDATKAFPIGSDNAPIILKWKLQNTDEGEVPFLLNFWPNEEDGRTVVSIEYTAQKEGLVLSDVTIAIPCPSSEPPDVTQNLVKMALHQISSLV